jgi:hypothetical protein
MSIRCRRTTSGTACEGATPSPITCAASGAGAYRSGDPGGVLYGDPSGVAFGVGCGEVYHGVHVCFLPTACRESGGFGAFRNPGSASL